MSTGPVDPVPAGEHVGTDDPAGTDGYVVVSAPLGAPEILSGDDLVSILLGLVDLEDGDIVVITSKVVAKAEGRVRPETDREQALPDETARVVARRGQTTIVRTRHGLTMAAAGIDASNVALGSVVLLPEDPDASARRLRVELIRRTGRRVAVVVTDTAGRAWREGQTDIAIGAAGLGVIEDFRGRRDPHGNELAVSAAAVADEIAGAAELAQGKLGRRPFAVVRGRLDLVLPSTQDGPGARALVRAEGADLFGYGAREAVIRALLGSESDRAPFGAPAEAGELAAAITLVTGLGVEIETPALLRVRGGVPPDDSDPRISALAFAHGWTEESEAGAGGVATLLRPAGP